MTDHEELVIELKANLLNLKEDVADIRQILIDRLNDLENRVDKVESRQDKMTGAVVAVVPFLAVLGTSIFEMIKKVL